MKNKVIIAAACSLLPLLAAAQSGPADISPRPKKVTLREGYAIWPFRVTVDLGDRDLRRRVYDLPEYAHKSAYELDIRQDGATIKAVTVQALEYAKTSLAQMTAACDTVTCCTILDYPDEEYRVRQVDTSEGEWDLERLLLQVDFARFAKQNVVRIDGEPGRFGSDGVKTLKDYGVKYYINIEWVPEGGRRAHSLDLSSVSAPFGAAMKEIDRMPSLKANVLVLKNTIGRLSDGQLTNIVRYARERGVIIEEHN